jgi:hypothetical protein
MPLDSPAQRAALRTAIVPDGRIYEANAEAMHFYTRPAESAAARTYLQHRGINPSNIPGQYVIGYVMEPYVPDAVHTDPLPGVRAAGGHVFEAVSIEICLGNSSTNTGCRPSRPRPPFASSTTAGTATIRAV